MILQPRSAGATVRVPVAALVTALLLFLPRPGLAGQDSSEELEQWFSSYVELWKDPSASDKEAITRYFAAPHYEVDESGATLVTDPSEHYRRLWKAWDELVEAEGDRAWAGEKVHFTIETFSAGGARIKSTSQGYDQLGDDRPECQLFDYQVAKFDDGWKFTGLMMRTLPHECDSPQ